MPFFRDLIDALSRRTMEGGVDPSQAEVALYPERLGAEMLDTASQPILGAGRAILSGVKSVLPEAITGATPESTPVAAPITPRGKAPVAPGSAPSPGPMVGPPKPAGEVMATVDGRTADYTGTAHQQSPGPLAGSLVEKGRVAGYGRQLMANPTGGRGSTAGEVEQVHGAEMAGLGRQLEAAKGRQELQFANLTPEQKAQLIQAQKTPTTGEDAATTVRAVYGTPEEFVQSRLNQARALSNGQPVPEQAIAAKAQNDYFQFLTQEATSLKGKAGS